MTEITASNDPERIEAAAEQYRAWGYHVVVRPEAHSLPDFLAVYRPDLIATRDGETIVVEVKTRRALMAESHAHEIQVKHLTRLIGEHPGWRFELVLVNDKTGPPAGAVAFDPARAHRALEESRDLLADGYVGPAMLVGWSALEAALRLLMASEGVEPRSLSTPPLLAQAVEEGLVSRDDYRTLRAMTNVRNALAHGYETDAVSVDAANRLLDLTDRLLNEASAPESA